MKKQILFAIFALLSVATFAQKKGLTGTWFATCQLGYQQTDNGGGGTAKNTTVLPIVGVFVAPSTAVGVAVGYVGVNSEDTYASGVTLKTNLLVLEPLVRKYWNIHGGLFFVGQLAAPIITGKEKTADIKVSQFGLTASGGFDYVMGKHFTVEFLYNLANFSYTDIKGYPGTTGDIKTTDLSLAHVATVDSKYNEYLFGANGNIVSPLAFGFKFLF